MRLLLFDIDGTLLRCGPQVKEVFASSLESVYGVRGDLEGYSFAGRTDPGIVLDLMTAAGLQREDVLARLPEMQARYLERLDFELEAPRMRLLPGVLEVLERLAVQPGVTLGLLTGNWHLGARIKLSRFGLNRFFAFGAFGDDGFQRRQLLPAALQRAATATGETFHPGETLIIGDSLLDVDCAHAHGVPVLAVATGYHSAAELTAAGADWVVAELPAAGVHLPLFGAGGGG